jgi:hypothetical protein
MCRMREHGRKRLIPPRLDGEACPISDKERGMLGTSGVKRVLC